MSGMFLKSLQSNQSGFVQARPRRAALIGPAVPVIALIILTASLIVESSLTSAQRSISFERFEIYP